MLAARISNKTTEEQKRSFNQLLSQINSSSVNDYDQTKFTGKEYVTRKDEFLEFKQSTTSFQERMTGYLLQLLNDVSEVKDEIKMLTNESQGIRDILLRSDLNLDVTGTVMSVKQIADKYSYTIPLPSMDEFEKFDKELADPRSSLKADICASLPTFTDVTLVISKSIVKMLKMFLTKEVAMQFTASKLAKGKRIMKNTNFFYCIEATIRKHRTESKLSATEKEMVTALSVVLSNAQNWNKRQTMDSSHQINSSQNDFTNMEILHCADGDPLFELQYRE